MWFLCVGGVNVFGLVDGWVDGLVAWCLLRLIGLLSPFSKSAVRVAILSLSLSSTYVSLDRSRLFIAWRMLSSEFILLVGKWLSGGDLLRCPL